jgi:hypothetical protein
MFALTLAAEPRVGLHSTHERLVAILPMTGAGTKADPRRPMFAPAPQAMAGRPTRTSLLAWSYIASDDGQWALVEFVAPDRAAFAPSLANRSYKFFEKGKAKRSEIELEFRKYRKDVDLSRLGVRLP